LNDNNLNTAFIPDVYQNGGQTKSLPILPLRSMNGYDEKFVINSISNGASESSIATELLVRLQDKAQLANNDNLDEDLKSKKSETRSKLDQMSIGDQTALLLQIRRMTFGETLSMEFRCPSCHELSSLELKVSDLLQIQKSKSKRQYDIELDGYSVQLRPIQIGDIAALSAFNGIKEEDDNGKSIPISNWTNSLIKSCIISSDPPLPAVIPDEFLYKIGLKLGELDPIADVVLSMICPHCNHSFRTPFFIEHFFLQEILMRQQQLDQEIHWLAFYYHWNENEILSLPIKRRKKYVELIAQTLYAEGS
jgi:hypothetical protein